MKLIIDTNFFIDLIRFKISLADIDLIGPEKPTLYTLNSVIRELNKIANSKNRDSKYAKVALKFIDLHQIKVLNSFETNTDKAIFNSADEDTIVATNDAELKRKLKKKGVTIIYLRSKKQLSMS